jgi:hypothetical protein
VAAAAAVAARGATPTAAASAAAAAAGLPCFLAALRAIFASRFAAVTASRLGSTRPRPGSGVAACHSSAALELA